MIIIIQPIKTGYAEFSISIFKLMSHIYNKYYNDMLIIIYLPIKINNFSCAF